MNAATKHPSPYWEQQADFQARREELANQIDVMLAEEQLARPDATPREKQDATLVLEWFNHKRAGWERSKKRRGRKKKS